MAGFGNTPFQKFWGLLRPSGFRLPVILVLFLINANLFAQNPGGVGTAPTIWYQASSYSAVWPNQGSLGLPGYLTTTGTPTYSLLGDAQSNFNPFVYFSAIGQYASTAIGLSDANITALGNSYTTFAAVRDQNQNYGSNNRVISSPFLFGTNTGDFLEPGIGFTLNGNANSPINASNFYVGTASGPQSLAYTGSSIIPGSAVILMSQADPTALRPTNNFNLTFNGNGTTAYMNGIGQTYSIGTANGAFSSVAGGTGSSQHYIFVGDANSTYGITGRVQEIVMFNTVLTNTQTKQVNTYLGIKNGITLGHDYVNASGGTVYSLAANSGYVSNIAGIGRDDISASLYQKQSNSVNMGNQVLIGLSTLANSNVANTGTLSNGQYLIWGDNGLARLPEVAVSGAGAANYRFRSVWKVQNTGSVGMVRVAWPSGFSNLALIRGGDPAFSSGNVVTDMSANTVTVGSTAYNYADVTLADGQYFTFAAFVPSAPGGVLTGLSHWYRADTGVTNTGNGTAATAWTDQFQKVSSAQIGTSALPNYNTGSSTYFNFNPAVNFTATNQTLGNISKPTLTSLSFDVFTLTRQGLSGTRFFNIGKDNNNVDGSNWDQPGFYAGAGYTRRDSVGNLVVNGNIDGTGFAPSSPSIMYSHFMNTSISHGLNGARTGSAYTHSPMGMMYGGHIFGSNNSSTPPGGDDGGFTGSIGELIIYGDSTVSAQQRNRIDAYLALKYGVTLDTSVSYLDANSDVIWDRTANLAYYNNVISISRDDISLLNQRISKSFAAALDSITISTDSNFVNVNSAHAAIAVNQSFFTVGNDLGSITTNTPFTYGGNSYKRIVRRWEAQAYNFGQTPYIGISTATLTAALGAAPAGSSYALLSATDPNFTANVKLSALATSAGISYAGMAPPASSGSSYFTYAVVNNSVLPVTLIGFNGILQPDKTVLLDWSTANETHNSGFNVQRSTDGALSWGTLGFVGTQAAGGNSSSLLGYNYIDRSPAAGTTDYYRLQQVDMDGNSSYSNIVGIPIPGLAQGLKVFPNPAHGILNISGLTIGDQAQVISVNGQVLQRFTVTATSQQIDVSKFAAGNYIIKTTPHNGPGMQSIGFVIN